MTGTPLRIAIFGFGQQNIVPSDEYGNKAAGLAAMAALGIPVPPGFALPTAVCRHYFEHDCQLPEEVPQLLQQGIAHIERATGSVYGGTRKPLLVSVRSGAPVSMPGVMDTILNVGLTPVSVRGLLASTGNPRFVYDTYRRFLENYGSTVFAHAPLRYIIPLKEMIRGQGVADERELDYQNLKELCIEYRQVYTDGDQRTCLDDANRQLAECMLAVIRSWAGPRAELFRTTELLKDAAGTAVTVQAMVYGNLGASSGAGVAFTRNPWSGAREMLVDFRFGAQGEDVVSGDRAATTQAELAEIAPEVYRELIQICQRLEAHFRDMQDLEFTVQDGRLFLLQCRSGKRAPLATLRIAVELCEDGIIPRSEALRRLNAIDINAIRIQTVDADQLPLATGIPASGGVVYGTIALTVERAEQDASRSPVILLRETASPDDIAGIDIATGLLTARGARTSHAAVVARQLGKVCIVNCTDLKLDPARHRCTIGGTTLREGDEISLDGNQGAVYRGRVQVTSKPPADLIARIQYWEGLPD